MGYKDFHSPNVGSQQPPVGTTSKPDRTQEFIDKIVEAKERIAMVDALGGVISPDGQFHRKEDSGKELTGAAVISKSLEVVEKQNEKMQEMVKSRDADVVAARLEADKAKDALYTTVITQISGAMDRLEKIRDEIKTGSTQKSLLEQLEEAKKVGAILNPQVPLSPSSSTGDASLTMQLEQMRQNHEATMRKFDIELAKMNQDLQIRLLEFQESRKDKDREYEDSKARRQDAFSTVGDIVAAATAGFKDKIAGSGGVASEVPNSPKSQIVPGFNCKDCGTPIAVPEGVKEVVCPNPKCGAQYSMVPGS